MSQRARGKKRKAADVTFIERPSRTLRSVTKALVTRREDIKQREQKEEKWRDPKKRALIRLGGTLSLFSPREMASVMEMLDLKSLAAWHIAVRSMAGSYRQMSSVITDFLQQSMRLKVIHDYQYTDRAVLKSRWFRRFIQNSTFQVRTLRLNDVYNFPRELWHHLVTVSGEAGLEVIDLNFESNQSWIIDDEELSDYYGDMIYPLRNVKHATHIRINAREVDLSSSDDKHKTVAAFERKEPMKNLRQFEFFADTESTLPAGTLAKWLPNMPALRILRVATQWNQDDLNALSRLKHLRIVTLISAGRLQALDVERVNLMMENSPKILAIIIKDTAGGYYGWERINSEIVTDVGFLALQHLTNKSITRAEWAFNVHEETQLEELPENPDFQWNSIDEGVRKINRVWKQIEMIVPDPRQAIARMIHMIHTRRIRIANRIVFYKPRDEWTDNAWLVSAPWATPEQIEKLRIVMSDGIRVHLGNTDSFFLDVDARDGGCECVGVSWHNIHPWLMATKGTKWQRMALARGLLWEHTNDVLDFLSEDDQLEHLTIVYRYFRPDPEPLEALTACNPKMLLELVKRNPKLKGLQLPRNVIPWTREVSQQLLMSRSWEALRLNVIGPLPSALFLAFRNCNIWIVSQYKDNHDGDDDKSSVDVITESHIEQFTQHNPKLTMFEWYSHPPNILHIPEVHSRGLLTLGLAFASNSIHYKNLIELKKNCPELANLRLDFPVDLPLSVDVNAYCYPPPTPGRVFMVNDEQSDLIERVGTFKDEYDYEDEEEKEKDEGDRLVFVFTRRGKSLVVPDLTIMRPNWPGWNYIKTDWPNPEELNLILPEPLTTTSLSVPIPVQADGKTFIPVPDLTDDEARRWLDFLRNESKTPLPVAVVRTSRGKTVPPKLTGITYVFQPKTHLIIDYHKQLVFRPLPAANHHLVAEHLDDPGVVRFDIPKHFEMDLIYSYLPMQWRFRGCTELFIDQGPTILSIAFLHLRALNPDTPERLIANRLLEMGAIPFYAYIQHIRFVISGRGGSFSSVEVKRSSRETKSVSRPRPTSNRYQTHLEREIRRVGNPIASRTQIEPVVTAKSSDWQEFAKEVQKVDSQAVQKEEDRLQKWLDKSVQQVKDDMETRAILEVATSLTHQRAKIIWISGEIGTSSQWAEWKRALKKRVAVRLVLSGWTWFSTQCRIRSIDYSPGGPGQKQGKLTIRLARHAHLDSTQRTQLYSLFRRLLPASISRVEMHTV